MNEERKNIVERLVKQTNDWLRKLKDNRE